MRTGSITIFASQSGAALGFIPSFELIEEHENSYELVFILSDSGFGVTLFVPKLPVTELVRFCREFTLAQQATSSLSGLSQ